MSTARIRRSSDEVRDLMLISARNLFRSQGYEATSTRQICDHAGVSESMLFRHFGSKKTIFDEAVLKPFVEFVAGFIGDWVARGASEVIPERLAYSFVGGFAKLCHDNPDLLEVFSKQAADNHNSPAGHGSELMEQLVDTLATQVDAYHRQVSLDFVMDPVLSVRLTIAMIVGWARLGGDFLGEMDDELTTEIAAFVVRGAGYPGDGRVRKVKPSGTRRSAQRARRRH